MHRFPRQRVVDVVGTQFLVGDMLPPTSNLVEGVLHLHTIVLVITLFQVGEGGTLVVNHISTVLLEEEGHIIRAQI